MNYLKKFNGLENPEQVNGILKKLNKQAKGSVKVFAKEVCFKSNNARNVYVKRMEAENCYGHNKDDFATSEEMMRAVDTTGSLFLVSCRETKANVYTQEAFVNPEKINEIAQRNRKNALDWHSNAIFYKAGIVYFFEPRLDLSLKEFKIRTCQFKHRARLVDFIKNKNGLPIKKIFIGGDKVRGNCRAKAFEFIKNMVKSERSGIPCSLYRFYEFVLGPRKPSINRVLRTLTTIPEPEDD